MSDTTKTPEAPGAAESGQISYHEKQELGFLERLLLDRRINTANAILFACATLSLALGIFHLLAAVFGAPEGRSFRSVHLTVMLVLAVMMYPLFRGSMREPVLVPGDPRNALRALGFGIDLVLVAAVLFVQLWTIWDIDAFHMRFGEKATPDLIVGGVCIFIVLEATRRAVGWAMVIITGFFILHSLYANYFFDFSTDPRCASGSSSTSSS